MRIAGTDTLVLVTPVVRNGLPRLKQALVSMGRLGIENVCLVAQQSIAMPVMSMGKEADRIVVVSWHLKQAVVYDSTPPDAIVLTYPLDHELVPSIPRPTSVRWPGDRREAPTRHRRGPAVPTYGMHPAGDHPPPSDPGQRPRCAIPWNARRQHCPD